MKYLLPFFLFPALAFGADLLEQIDKKLNPFSTESVRQLINIEPDGTRKEFVMYMVKKDKTKVASLFLSPASDKGRATLRVDQNMWLYIPGIAKPLRIASMQSVTGGVFNNADIMQVDFGAEYKIASQKETPELYHLDLVAKTPESTYEKLRMNVDKKSLFPTSIDCIAGGIVLKTIRYLKPKDFGGGIVRPSVLETTSPLQKGFKSIIVYGSIKKRPLDNAVFTLENLSKLDDLR
ncbi:MAG: outer membrane lipoprotein-sorting protein [Campylobacterales bacterium]|nr:outer membrane lipoprotein-sorting protein [Campylobacterales bacterium]